MGSEGKDIVEDDRCEERGALDEGEDAKYVGMDGEEGNGKEEEAGGDGKEVEETKLVLRMRVMICGRGRRSDGRANLFSHRHLKKHVQPTPTLSVFLSQNVQLDADTRSQT